MHTKQKILIVDDKKENLTALRRVLGDLDAEILEATSGNQALTMTLDYQFAVAIVDVKMPVMSGYELAALLRGDKRTNAIPIIFLTASLASEQEIFKGYEAGGIDFIVKPCQPQVLLGKVRNFLELNRSRRELHQYRDHLEALVAERTQALRRANEAQQNEIVKRKLLEEQLRASETKLRSIVDNIGIGIALISSDMKILEFNRQMRRWFPRVCAETNPVCHHVLNDPLRDAPCKDCPIAGALQNGRLHEVIQKLSGPDGTRSYRIIATPVPDELEETPAAIALIEDVTERLSLEEQLIQSQKLEAVGHLAGGVAHDFNNMLSIVMGYGEDLLEQLHPLDPLRECVQEIMSASRRSVALTRQLLAFSRKQVLQREVLNLNDLIRNLEKMLGRLIGEDIELQTVLCDALECVEVDPGQLEQVIMNLSVNARDAMPRGGRLTIETANVVFDETYCRKHTCVSPGDYVVLAVADTGCGMDDATRKRIFDPFFTTKEKNKGSGLGLSTVYGIVKQMGGTIWVYSEKGKGTVFKIYLPRTQALPAAHDHAVDSRAVPVKDARLLVVEDELNLRKLIEKLLTGLGYKVTIASNGGEALLLVEEKGLRPDLLLTDVVMPGMSGRVLSDRLRKTRPDLKVLFMSGYTDSMIMQHGVLDPGTPFIQKPFSRHDLAQKIAGLLHTFEK